MDFVENYINASKMQYRDAKDIIEEFSCEISKMRGKCIDIGCGPGYVSKTLLLPALSPDAKLVGADISASMLEYANQKHRDDKRLSFTLLNIEIPELPSNEIEQYDNVVSLYCLHWCQNTRRAFENIYKLLRPGGKALTMFLAYNSGFDAYIRMNQNPKYRPYTQDASRYVPYFQRCKDARANLRKMLEDIGFKVLHCSNREKTYTYENQQTLENHIIAVNPFISRVPDDMKKEFADVVVREIMSHKLLLPKTNENNQQDYSIMDRYYLLIAYIKKPIS